MNVDEEILVCAVRYALGRHTYIVKTVIDNVISNIDKLGEKTKFVICKDIAELLDREDEEAPNEQLGMNSIDSEEWFKLLVILFRNLKNETKDVLEGHISNPLMLFLRLKAVSDNE